MSYLEVPDPAPVIHEVLLCRSNPFVAGHWGVPTAIVLEHIRDLRREDGEDWVKVTVRGLAATGMVDKAEGSGGEEARAAGGYRRA